MHRPEDMATSEWSPATRDHAEKTLEKIKEHPEQETRLRLEFHKFYVDHPECLF